MSLVLKEVTVKSQTGEPILDKVNFTANNGEIIAIVGESGSGKTTLTQVLNALIIADSGEVIITTPTGEEFKLSRDKKKQINFQSLRKNVSISSQSAEMQIFEDTVMKELLFGPLNFGISRSKAIKSIYRWIKETSILSKSQLNEIPFLLSGGEKKRLTTLSTIIIDAYITVFDEPTISLDYDGQQKMINFIKHIQKIDKNKIIIFVTHNMDHVLELADRILVLRKGRLLMNSTIPAFFYEKFDKISHLSHLPLPFIVEVMKSISKRTNSLINVNQARHRIRNMDDLSHFLFESYQKRYIRNKSNDK